MVTQIGKLQTEETTCKMEDVELNSRGEYQSNEFFYVVHWCAAKYGIYSKYNSM